MKTTNILAFGLCLSLAHTATGQFAKITTGPMASDSAHVLSAAWADFDNDGDMDAFATAALNANNLLYRNLGGGVFEKITSGPLGNAGGDSTAAAWGDYDNDGFLDLFVANRFQNHFLYRGTGATGFETVTNSPVLAGGPETYHCAWADYDSDGHIDLIVVNLFGHALLYRNNGDGTFSQNTTASIVNGANNWIGSAWGDYDNDSRPDVFMVGANFGPGALFQNNGGGSFSDTSSSEMMADAGGGTSASWVDYDNDGDLDLFITNREGVNFLYRNNGDATFAKVTTGEVVTDVADSNTGAWGDYDNDGWLDLYVANGDSPSQQANFLYRNNRDGTFTRVSAGLPTSDLEHSYSAVWVDFNNDGALDLHVANNGTSSLYQNSAPTNNWLKVRLAGTFSNRAAIGARVKVTANIQGATRTLMRQLSGESGLFSQNLELHFGLGQAAIIDEVRVEWPSGNSTVLSSVSVNQRLSIDESATTQTLVIPAGVTATDGNWYSGIFREPQLRIQLAYDAANFSGEPLTINELRFRRDVNEPAFSDASTIVTVKLSTTPLAPGNLNPTFAQNSGPDETTVYDGQWTHSSPTVLPQGTVRPFEIALPLTTPFTYDPAAGNLLVDIRTTSTSPGNWTDAVTGHAGVARVLSLDAGASTGTWEATGDVIQLVSGPPMTLELSPPGGTFTNSTQVVMTTGVPTAVIRYTTDGSDPTTNSPAYTAPLTLTETTTVKARLFLNGLPASDIVLETYTKYVPPAIQFVPPGTLFTNQISIGLIDNTGCDATLYYTIDGSDPTPGSMMYAGPIVLSSGAVVKARAYFGGYFISEVFTETYARVYCFEDDGVPFAWREEYYGPGFLTDPNAAAEADSDFDGFTTREEYEQGTDPTDGESRPEIMLTVRLVPKLTFTTVPGRTYRILRCTGVQEPAEWEVLEPGIVATGNTLDYVDCDPQENSIYQVELVE